MHHGLYNLALLNACLVSISFPDKMVLSNTKLHGVLSAGSSVMGLGL